jgi:hypothetical protein
MTKMTKRASVLLVGSHARVLLPPGAKAENRRREVRIAAGHHGKQKQPVRLVGDIYRLLPLSSARFSLRASYFATPRGSAQCETLAQALELVANEAFREGLSLVRLTA